MSDETQDDRIRMGDQFAPRGFQAIYGNIYTVMGLPKVKGQWVSVARDANGAVVSFPENIFHAKFYRIQSED